MFRTSTLLVTLLTLFVYQGVALMHTAVGADKEEPGTIQFGGVVWKVFADPADKTGAKAWTVSEDGSVLSCTGKPLGYVFTKENYDNVLIRLQWRRSGNEKASNAGVLLRKSGEDKIWPKSLEAQLNAGNAGDFVGLDGYPVVGDEKRLVNIDHPKFGKVAILAKMADAEKKRGEWNDYEIRADGETVTIKVNGREVNRVTGCPATSGPILLTAEGNPIEFRKLSIVRLKK